MTENHNVRFVRTNLAHQFDLTAQVTVVCAMHCIVYMYTQYYVEYYLKDVDDPFPIKRLF